jgi:hypothetical protein
MTNGESLGVVRFTKPLPPSAVKGKEGDEIVRYDDGNPNNNYKVVKDDNNSSWNSTPWREQNCVGLVLEKKYGIKNAVVDASTFHTKVLQGLSVPEVGRSDVQPGDVGIMFYEGGGAGHAFYVDKVEGSQIKILSKDQWERTRSGTLSDGDDVHKQYKGEIKFFRLDPNTHKLVPK